MKKLSIIIPFYNAQRYLERCLLSVCNQDIHPDDYEVIAVDDASTDNSSNIVIRLQSSYRNLRLISLQSNKKQGGARNEGLRVAKGEWVWFVDSDDYIFPNVLGKLLNECKDELDFLHFDYYFDEFGVITVSPNPHFETLILTGQELLQNPSHNWWTSCINVWQRIVRRDFLLQNNLCFAEAVQYEDVDYSFRLFLLARRVRHIDSAPYVYRKNAFSTTHKIIDENVMSDWYRLSVRCVVILKKNRMDDKSRRIIIQYIHYITNELKEKWKSISKTQQNAFLKEIEINTTLSLMSKVSMRTKSFILLLVAKKLFSR